MLAHGALITPDAAAASLGVLAGYVFWRWWKEGGFTLAFGAGIATAVALATKFTLLLLLPLWCVLWLVGTAVSHVRGRDERSPPQGTAIELAVVLAMSLFGINLFYCFDGTFTALGDYSFVSGTLSGVPDVRSMQLGGNRFAGSWLGRVPIPFPREFVQGIDCQQLDFDHKDWSFLCGEWRLGGWWYYYLAAMAFKSPLAWGFLVALAIPGATLNKRLCLVDQAALLLPALAVFAAASAQTGFNHHYRYVLPALPFLFVWVAVSAVRATQLPVWRGSRWPQGIAALLVAAYVVESLCVYPHSLSFFNRAVGGPMEGHRYLSDSCVDWGQDLFLLRKWHADHPEARPFYASYFAPDGQVIEDAGSERQDEADPVTWPGPWPGWHAMSVTALHSRDPVGRMWGELKPTARVGYSIVVFHLTEDVARDLQAKQARIE